MTGGLVVGYARVSSTDQSLEVQLDQLKQAGCQKIFAEKMSGKEAANRAEFQAAIAYCREGDIFVVTRLDRAARSMPDLVKFILDLQAKGVEFRCLLQAGVDTTTPEGRLMLNLLGSFAEFEREIRRARQGEGIAKAKLKGKYNRFRKAPHVIATRIRALRDEGCGAAEILRKLKTEGMKISRPTLYRLVPDGWSSEPAWAVAAREKKKEAGL